ncbi:MAG: DUF2807 domain-containing protein [Ignavibacteriales bacterium]|nr:DUF2807 domain-containing protein [Ignavibacteriales bacterium]
MLEGVGEVYLTQGKIQSIRIEADKDIMGKIKTERIHGKLVLGLRGNNHFLSKIKYYITLNEIKDLEINGSGSIELTEPVRTENLYGVINGNGNIDLQGICRTFRCEINGAGTISAFDLKSKKCRAEINGTGTCEVFATENLDAEISGVGKIVYIGEPDVESEVNGIGAVYSR